MKKLIWVVAIALAFGLNAKAEYLYWQVGDSLNGQTFDSGTTYEVGLYQYSSSGSANDATLVGKYQGTLGMNSAQEANVSSYSGSNFFIEVFTYDSTSGQYDSQVTSTENNSWSYSDLFTSGAISSSSRWAEGAIANTMSVWNGAQVVPEPTSGLLTLVGLALLGLRRRRA